LERREDVREKMRGKEEGGWLGRRK